MTKKSSNTAISSSFSAQRLYWSLSTYQHNYEYWFYSVFKKNDKVQHDLRIDRGVTCRRDVCFFLFWLLKCLLIGKKIVSLGDFATGRQPSLSWYRSQTQTVSYLTFQLMFKLFVKAGERLNMNVTFFH